MNGRWALLLILSFFAVDPATGRTGMVLDAERPKDRYQCSPVQQGVQNVDLLINGGNERFQGIARVVNGKVTEISGVVSSYAMQAPGVPLITPADEVKEWARWMVFNKMFRNSAATSASRCDSGSTNRGQSARARR